MAIPEDLRELYAEYANPLRCGSDNQIVVDLIERINVLTADRNALKAQIEPLKAERDSLKRQIDNLWVSPKRVSYLPVSY